MIKKLNVINGIPQWTELVGLESLIKDYRIMCVGYNQTENKLLIAEYRVERNYTNEIITVDSEKAIKILKMFNIEIQLINKFCWTKETILKVNGLQQAGFSHIIYSRTNKTSLLDGKMEIQIFNEEEKAHIENTNRGNEIRIELININ